MNIRYQVRLGVAVIMLSAASAAVADSRGKWVDGQEVYEKTCGYCHDRGIGPVIKGQEKPPQLIQLVVRSGLGAMPAFRATEIDDQALAEVIEYVAK